MGAPGLQGNHRLFISGEMGPRAHSGLTGDLPSCLARSDFLSAQLVWQPDALQLCGAFTALPQEFPPVLFPSRASQPVEETTANTVLLRLKVNRCQQPQRNKSEQCRRSNRTRSVCSSASPLPCPDSAAVRVFSCCVDTARAFRSREEATAPDSGRECVSPDLGRPPLWSRLRGPALLWG